MVDLLFAEATPETAKRTADPTWDLVHDRPDDDPVKQRVVKGHEALARLSAESAPPAEELTPSLFTRRQAARARSGCCSWAAARSCWSR